MGPWGMLRISRVGPIITPLQPAYEQTRWEMAPGVVRTLVLISGTAPSSRRSFTTICSARLRAVFLGYAFSNSSLTVCGLGFIVVSPRLRLRCQAVVDQEVFQIVH